jgi:catechol 2,3-dioxygenase-like lactoylglutathione lyase family enzyme
MVSIRLLDHLVLTVASIERTSAFYARVLGMTPQRFISGGVERHALAFGAQKFNLHQVDRVVDANVKHATPGSADLCLLTDTPIERVVEHLGRCEVAVIAGPSRRTGARHALMSVYFHDPDENLVEVANELVDPQETT